MIIEAAATAMLATLLIFSVLGNCPDMGVCYKINDVEGPTGHYMYSVVHLFTLKGHINNAFKQYLSGREKENQNHVAKKYVTL